MRTLCVLSPAGGLPLTRPACRCRGNHAGPAIVTLKPRGAPLSPTQVEFSFIPWGSAFAGLLRGNQHDDDPQMPGSLHFGG
jgi:hypothetical protein